MVKGLTNREHCSAHNEVHQLDDWELFQIFFEGSQEFFFNLSSEDRPQNYREWITQSLSLIQMLSPDTTSIQG
jgi:hypothetical protein